MNDNSTAKAYNRAKNRLALIEPFLALGVLVFIQLSGVSAAIREVSYRWTSIRPASVGIYAVIFGFFFYLSMFAINFYKTYVVEHRFGLSNIKIGQWFRDEGKKGVISLALFLLFIEAVYFLLQNAPGAWWFILACGWLVVTVLLARIAPVVLIPLFFKSEPLDNNELKQRLLRLARKSGIPILDVFRLKLSAKTKKANAALTGLGKTRRVLLGDTLIDNYSGDEIEVVLAHELGHHKYFHIWKLISLGAVSTLIVFYLTKLSLPSAFRAFGNIPLTDVAGFPIIIFIITLYSSITSILHNAYSRRLEYQADRFAISITAMSGAFISLMTKLSRQNLSDPSPSKFIEIMLYDHPPITKRIRAAEGLTG